MAGYYGKRPMWQWIVIYALVGAVVYFLIYYFILAPKGGGYTPSQSGQTSSPSGSTTSY